MNDKVHIENALYIVPTPIGNMEDITIRALKTLKRVEIIACEDTRNTGQLLKKLDIGKKTLISYHNYNERSQADSLLNYIETGKSVALVSDAGTPLISDPGYYIIREAILRGIKIISLPGASAFLTALPASGLETHSFIFMGFPPKKKGRQTFIKKVCELDNTVILYESPHKILKLLNELKEYLDTSKEICLARELTKYFEEYLRGNVNDCITYLENKTSIKGEFVVLIGNKKIKHK